MVNILTTWANVIDSINPLRDKGVVWYFTLANAR